MDIDPLATEWRELRKLLRVYLNQDFPEEYGRPEGAVMAFCRRRTPDQLATAADEVRAILDGTEDDESTVRALEPFGREYYPECGGWSIREWLAELERVLRDPSRPTRLNDRPRSS